MSSNNIDIDYEEIVEDDDNEVMENNSDNEDDNDNDNEDPEYEVDADIDADAIDDDDDDLVDPNLEDPIIPGGKEKENNAFNLVDEYLNDTDDDSDDETYFQKFDQNVTQEYINANHPEVLSHNFDEITKMMQIHRDMDGHIVDPCHKTLPILTKFEKTRIIGQRAKQIETGSTPFVKVPNNIIDSYLIAELELQQRKLPFIIRRPLPNGTCEYWDVNDLEMIGF